MCDYKFIVLLLILVFQLIICLSVEKKKQKGFKYLIPVFELFLLSECIELNFVENWKDQCTAHLCLLQEYIASRIFLNSISM